MSVQAKGDRIQDRLQDRAQVKRGRIQEELLVFCKTPKSLKEIMEKFEYKSVDKFRKNYINILLQSGRLERTETDRPTSKNQKYIAKNNED